MERQNAAAFKALAVALERRTEEVLILLSELADEELDHLDALEALWKEQFGDLEALPGDADESHPGMELKVDDIKGVQDVLRVARIAERNAAAFYQRAAEEAGDDGARALYTRLAEMEQEHVKAVDPNNEGSD